MNSKNYSQEDLIRIGVNLAAQWGGELIKVSYDTEVKKYMFDCTEHGELFYSTLTQEQLSDFDY